MVSRTNDDLSSDRGRLIPEPGRRVRRLKALKKIAGRRAAGLHARVRTRPVRAAGLLGAVCLALFAPLLLDDMVFQSSYLLQPSEDTIAIIQPAAITAQPPMRLMAGTLSLPPSPTGKARTGEALAAMVKGGSARMALKSPVFEIDASNTPRAAGQSAFDEFVSSLPPLIEALQSAAFETLAIRDGTVIFDLGGGRRETLTALDGEIGIKRRSTMTFKGNFRLRGEPVRFDMSIGARNDRRGTSRVPLKGTIESELFKANIDGSLDLDRRIALTGTQIDLLVPNVRSLARWLGHTWPSGAGFKDFAARGTLDWTGPTLAVTRGRYWLDGNEATGTLSVTLHPERSLVAGTLAFGTLDLTPYMAQAPAPGQSAAQQPQQSSTAPRSLIALIKAERDLRWPMIGVVDADLRVSAQDIRIGPFEAGRTAASVTIKSGQLIFNVAEVILDSGARGVFEFGVTGTASYPNYLLRGRLEEADLTSASQALTGMSVIRARGQAVFDVSSSGTSGADVVGGINGKIDIHVPEGAAIPCNHKSLSAAAKLPKPSGDVCGAPINIGPATLSARLVSGRIIAERADGTTNDELVSLKGSFDLPSGVIDAAITSGPVPAPRADGTRPDPLRADRNVVTIRGRPEALTITSVP